MRELRHAAETAKEKSKRLRKWRERDCARCNAQITHEREATHSRRVPVSVKDWQLKPWMSDERGYMTETGREAFSSSSTSAQRPRMQKLISRVGLLSIMCLSILCPPPTRVDDRELHGVLIEEDAPDLGIWLPSQIWQCYSYTAYMGQTL